MKDIFEEIVRLQKERGKAALASLVWSLGSVPMPRAAKMLIYENGNIAGTVGGGCLEAEVWQKAKEIIKEGKPKLLSFHLTEEQMAESGFICGGRAKILVEPILAGHGEEVFAAVDALQKRRRKGVSATLMEAEGEEVRRLERLLVSEDGCVVGQAQEEVLQEAKGMLSASPHEEPSQKNVKIGAAEVFLERLFPQPTAIICGAGHVGIAVAQIAIIAGFRVVAIDDREMFANRERLPFADEVIVAHFENAFAGLPIDEDCYIVAVTRGHLYDREVVEQALKTQARYIGMIGSRRKIHITFSQLEEKGFSREEIQRIHAPIGLNIGAETAQEIAVAIVAEMVKEMRQPNP
jgi:xanthine dehydrogenase accessory factor